MRILKCKIAKSKRQSYLNMASSEHNLQEDDSAESEMPKFVSRTKRIHRANASRSVQTRRKELTCQEYKDVLIIKNVVKNYGRAISSFACSRLSIPYLNNIQRELSFNLQSFLTYASNLKNTIQSIPSFRDAILIEENDTVEMKTNKLVFQKIAEIFIKYFSVNWIFSGKLLYKLEYLKLRSIMLKKIKAPNTLTSLKPLASR